MGVYLSTGWDGPYVLCNWNGWDLLFDLALEYGWKPLGAIDIEWRDVSDHVMTPILSENEVPPRVDFEDDTEKCYKSYFHNDGQMVDKDDCKAMLLALESAKSDIAKGNLHEGTCAERIARDEWTSSKSLAVPR